MSAETLAGSLLKVFLDGDLLGLDCFDLQDLLVKHGLLYEAPATEEDCETEWAEDVGLKPGDTIYKPTDLGRACLKPPSS